MKQEKHIGPKEYNRFLQPKLFTAALKDDDDGDVI